MPARMILLLILGMLVLPSCQLDQLGLSLRERAEQGDADAQFDLGLMNSKGEGVPQDYKEAARWFRVAAEQGHPSAQFDLGLTYNVGEAVPKDYIQAHMWYKLAAANGG